MAEKDNTFQNTVEALFRGMDSFITTKTVVGEAIHIDDTILLPLVAVTKIIDMAPDLISRFTGKKEEDGYTAEKVEHIINQEADKE